jgi:copper chaperone CopZ
MITTHFKLEHVSCPSCITHLEAMEDDLPGISNVRADFRKQQMSVEYDESIQTADGIVRAVEHMGYSAIPTKTGDNTAKEGSKWTKWFR